MSLFGLFLDFAGDSSAKSIIKEGLAEALDTMESMLANAGQETVFTDFLAPQFKENAQASPEDGWEEVDAGDYIDFMGEITEAGNQIMQDAYDYAAEISAEVSDSFDY